MVGWRGVSAEPLEATESVGTAVVVLAAAAALVATVSAEAPATT